MRTEQAFREFINSRISANLSPRAIEWYEDRLGPFVKFCAAFPRRPEPVEEFLASVRGSPVTKLDTFNALKTFFKFICLRHRIPNPMELVAPPHRPKVRMATLELCELAMLLQPADCLRDRALLNLIIDTAVRAGEVCSLLKHNIKQETIIVQGKTGWREVPISEETKELLLRLAAESSDDYVFHDDHGNPISRFSIYRIVRKYMERAAIKGPKLGSHRLRHAFGKNFLVQGGDLRSLQEIMGHADIETTQKYASLNLTDIVRKHQKFSPLKAAHAAARENLFATEALREAEEILKARKSSQDANEGNGKHLLGDKS